MASERDIDRSKSEEESAIERYLASMNELREFAGRHRLEALTIEPMSCLAEPPTTSAEILAFMRYFQEKDGEQRLSAIPVLLCGDISHGYADEDGVVVESNVDLLEISLPYMGEFHFKNTDHQFSATFGFGSAERSRGIVDLDETINLILTRRDTWPVSQLIGYLELPGPKLGRDYSDKRLSAQLSESVSAIQKAIKRQYAYTTYRQNPAHGPRD